IVFNLLSKKIRVVAFNRSPARVAGVVEKGAEGTSSVEELANKLKPPRIIWIMVTAGKAVDAVIDSLIPHLTKGDIIIDGGNSLFKDALTRGKRLENTGIEFLDIGTSGACLTVGGKKEVFEKVEPLLKKIAVEGGYSYMGPAGAGHFVKMIHNGIEYALLQSYSEGFEQLINGPYKLDLKEIARVWDNGSVIRSWLLELAEDALSKDPNLDKITGEIGGGQTGKWALETALETNSPHAALAHALTVRRGSKGSDAFSNRFIAALRNEFGGHEVKTKDQRPKTKD
ncbi:phosphogluconate dehydrogenase (NAD(+)-dependent, decarboxylating), partial [Candidatus Auribacterota bacterium]